MSKKVVSPGGNVSGVVELPGDKSISHRYGILASLAEGTSEILNYASSADCRSALECMRRLGIEIDANPECENMWRSYRSSETAKRSRQATA
jgi:5-enolpyruvylshikimate-3-phosphate synthase